MPERHRGARPAVVVTGAAVLAAIALVAVRMSVGTPPERPRARQVTEQEVTAVVAGAGVTRSPGLIVGVMESGRGAKEDSAAGCSFAWGATRNRRSGRRSRRDPSPVPLPHWRRPAGR
ncbi:hypothetical protein ACIQZB_08120 [Streptomyces sp. NPDC097727]|uniref:hypothetical protein n=1 Tax=Streptomyces sp. NPDC097727 TaxID=3366092 RepID=UPI003816226E